MSIMNRRIARPRIDDNQCLDAPSYLHLRTGIYTEMGNGKLDLFEKGLAVDICCANMLLNFRVCRLERSSNHGDNGCSCILFLALSTDVFVIPILAVPADECSSKYRIMRKASHIYRG
jgi:hypothetical protein